MYIKYADYTGKLAKGDIVLMSAAQFANGGDKLTGIPVAITPYGLPPVEMDEPNQVEPVPVPPEPSETELLRAEIATLKSRLAKVEAVPIVKTALEHIHFDHNMLIQM